MKPSNLSLRQRKILNLLLHSNVPLTGRQLAKIINVSDRTVRADIRYINDRLKLYKAEIQAPSRKGYVLHLDEQTSHQELINGLMAPNVPDTPESRLIHLTIRLCTANEPIPLDRLEDELYVGRSTVEASLRSFKHLYADSYPHIKLYVQHGQCWLENDESKIRKVLNKHMLNLWNYHELGTTLYHKSAFDAQVSADAWEAVSKALSKYHIRLQDAGSVSLMLSVVIAYLRLAKGHTLPKTVGISKSNIIVYNAVRDILGKIETKYGMLFPSTEYDALYQQLDMNQLHLDPSDKHSITVDFPQAVIQWASDYLRLLRSSFDIDFATDQELYKVLLQLLNQIYYDNSTNQQFTPAELRREYIVSLPMARLMQDLTQTYIGRYLNEAELMQLAACISGGLYRRTQLHPDSKLKTVLSCHMDFPTTWLLAQKLEATFGSKIQITDIIAINDKLNYDFSNVDLLITTTSLSEPINAGVDKLQITFRLNEQDRSIISNYLNHRILFKNPRHKYSISDLLAGADCIQATVSSVPAIHRILSQELSEGDQAPMLYEEFKMQESSTSYRIFSDYVFLYSLRPAPRTKITLLRLKVSNNRVKNKIHLVIAGVFSRNDMPMIPELCQLFYYQMRECESLSATQSGQELATLVSDYMYEQS